MALLAVLLLVLTQAPHSLSSRPHQIRTGVDLSLSPSNASVPAQSSDKPFVKLFVTPTPTRSTARKQPTDRPEESARPPRVVCGMVVIPAPQLDPAILMPPHLEAPDSRIRRIIPEKCSGE